MSSTEQSESLLDGDTYFMLLRIAQIGVEVGEARAAIQITESLQHLNPEMPHSRIAQGMAYVSLGQGAFAVRELEAAVECFPDFQLAKVMLGICMRLSGRSGWEAHLHAVIADGREEVLVGMVCELLGQARDASSVHVDAGSSETQPPPNFSSGYTVWG